MGIPGEPPGTREGCHYGFNASLLTQHNAVSYAVIMKQKLPSIKKSVSMKPRLVKIYSENNDFQYIETLRRKREKRQRQREFFIEQDFTQPTLLVVGNETWDMSAGYRELCSATVNIPIYGSASSLNLACATSILLYEIDRQRRNAQL